MLKKIPGYSIQPFQGCAYNINSPGLAKAIDINALQAFSTIIQKFIIAIDEPAHL